MAKEKSRTQKNKIMTVFMLILFVGLALLILLPIYAIFLASFKPGGQLVQYGLNLDLNFNQMSFKNYVAVLSTCVYYLFLSAIFAKLTKIIVGSRKN